MARSKRKTPVRAVTTSESEKSDKAASHRKICRTIHQVVPIEPDAVLPLSLLLWVAWVANVKY